MTKPSNFIINTDYLSIAEVVPSEDFSFTIPASSSTQDYSLDFATEPQNGSIDRIQVTIGDKTTPDHAPYFSPGNNSDNVGTIQVYRTSSTNMRVRVYIYSVSAAYPSIPVAIKVNRFRPPNVL
jgi:hypothetical protein